MKRGILQVFVRYEYVPNYICLKVFWVERKLL